MTCAVIVAGGEGTRIQSQIPKQYLTINGRQVLSFSVDTFLEHPMINKVILVVSLHYARQVKKNYPGCHVVLGGKTRQASSTNGVNAVPPGTEKVLVHDAARPFVTHQMITECVESLDECDGAVPILTPDNTMIMLNNGTLAYLDRQKVKAVQTPQGFRNGILTKAQRSGFETTDELGLVLLSSPKAKIHLFAGDDRNFKITTPLNLELASIMATQWNSRENFQDLKY